MLKTIDSNDKVDDTYSLGFKFYEFFTPQQNREWAQSRIK